jgi:hypothetical protein
VSKTASVLASLVLALLLWSSAPIASQEPTHTPTSVPDSCLRCWNGICPGTTTRSEVADMLDEAGMPYELTRMFSENDTFAWKMTSPSLANGDQLHVLNASASFDADDLVMNIGFATINLCAATIVEWLGEPPVVLRTGNDMAIDLVYPDAGLIFMINLYGSPAVRSIFHRTQSGTDYWISLYFPAERTTWDEVRDILAEGCVPAEALYNPWACQVE